MPKSTKRERQRQNREARREAMLAEEKRRRRLKTARNVGIFAVALVALVAVLQLTRDDDSSSDQAAASATCSDRKPSSAPTTEQYPAPPAMTIDPTATYEVVMSTSCGDIPMSLDAAAAPQTVNSFVFLAKEGFYDGTTFHRIVKGFVDQGGDPTGSGSGGPGYRLPDEPPADGYQAGDVALANSGPGTSGSQFFLVVSDNGAQQLGGPPYLYSIVGEMSTEGLKVAKKINTFATPEQKPSRDLYVFGVRVEEPTPATTAAP